MKTKLKAIFASKTVIYSCITCFLVIFIASIIYLYSSRPKVAYVRTLELVYGYNGMREAHAEFSSQVKNWQSNIDTLAGNYKRALNDYQKEGSSFSDAQRQEREQSLDRMKADLNQYSSVVSDEAKSREQKLTDAVLKQINSFVEVYSKSKGYDIVLGAEGNGSILYGTSQYDITTEVLAALNKDYKPLQLDSLLVSK